MKFTRIILLASVLLCLAHANLHGQYLGGSGDGYASVTSEEIVLAIEDIIAVGSVPEDFKLYQNYPNPFNPETRIPFDIHASGGGAVRTRVSISNIRGQVVQVLLDDTRPPGSYEISWDGKDEKGFRVPSGIYLYTVRFGEVADTKRMLLVK